ncbi:hypothetical protein RND71_014517 [Anisodus tanguticus]|uniref:Prolamin-like domain-containing protein n=1 Tax=Anisodus tanguticus TaxID=243964 RepID=A0AAE1VF41_9SOLA|nr:hypothetical protein RND71_014517 [Anisodus tanguticus]
MVSLNILSSFITILIISSAIPVLCKSHHHKEHSPPTNPPSQKEDAHDKYINSLPKDLIKFVQNCTKYLPVKCGEKVINAILEKGIIDKKCCHDLVRMGYECHKSLIKVYIGLPEVKNKIDPKVIKSNAKKVFKKCVVQDKKNNHSSHPPPILP